MKKESVSVAIPVYNGEKYVSVCIESLLNQTMKPDEIIVIDDGSTDDTIEIASQHPIKLLKHEKNKGLAEARNTSLKNAVGDIIIFIDCDAKAENDYIENMVKNYTEDTIAGVGGKAIEIPLGGLANNYRSLFNVQEWGERGETDFLRGVCFSFRKAVLEEIGGFNPYHRTNGEDVDICRRIVNRGYKLIYDPAVKVFHKRDDDMKSFLSQTYRAHYFGSVAILRNADDGVAVAYAKILGTIGIEFLKRVKKSLRLHSLKFLLISIAFSFKQLQSAIRILTSFKEIRNKDLHGIDESSSTFR